MGDVTDITGKLRKAGKPKTTPKRLAELAGKAIEAMDLPPGAGVIVVGVYDDGEIFRVHPRRINVGMLQSLGAQACINDILLEEFSGNPDAATDIPYDDE